MLPHLLRHAITKIVFDYTFCSRASLWLEFGAKACKVCVSHPVRGLLAPAQSQPLLHAQYCCGNSLAPSWLASYQLFQARMVLKSPSLVARVTPEQQSACIAFCER